MIGPGHDDASLSLSPGPLSRLVVPQGQLPLSLLATTIGAILTIGLGFLLMPIFELVARNVSYLTILIGYRDHLPTPPVPASHPGPR